MELLPFAALVTNCFSVINAIPWMMRFISRREIPPGAVITTLRSASFQPTDTASVSGELLLVPSVALFRSICIAVSLPRGSNEGSSDEP